MLNGQPTSSWPATAFSRVFGESAAQLTCWSTVSDHLSAAYRHGRPTHARRSLQGAKPTWNKSPRFSLCPIAREQCATHDAELILDERAPLATLLKTFPHTRYYPEWRLVTWHPCGLFDDALADKISGVIGTSIVCNHRGVRRFADGARNHFRSKHRGPLRHPHGRNLVDRVRRIKCWFLWYDFSAID